jgi:hypothetical protein
MSSSTKPGPIDHLRRLVGALEEVQDLQRRIRALEEKHGAGAVRVVSEAFGSDGETRAELDAEERRLLEAIASAPAVSPEAAALKLRAWGRE